MYCKLIILLFLLIKSNQINILFANENIIDLNNNKTYQYLPCDSIEHFINYHTNQILENSYSISFCFDCTVKYIYENNKYNYFNVLYLIIFFRDMILTIFYKNQLLIKICLFYYIQLIHMILIY